MIMVIKIRFISKVCTISSCRKSALMDIRARNTFMMDTIENFELF